MLAPTSKSAQSGEGDLVGDGQVCWICADDSARRLEITKGTLYRLIDTGQLPAHKFGRMIRL